MAGKKTIDAGKTPSAVLLKAPTGITGFDEITGDPSNTGRLPVSLDQLGGE